MYTKRNLNLANMHKYKNCVHVCLCIVVHNCCTQHSTEQFWLSSLLSSRQTPELRCCLLDLSSCENDDDEDVTIPHQWSSRQQQDRTGGNVPLARQYVGIHSLSQSHWNCRQIPHNTTATPHRLSLAALLLDYWRYSVTRKYLWSD